jgi:hypothetical protein
MSGPPLEEANSPAPVGRVTELAIESLDEFALPWGIPALPEHTHA